MGEQEERLIEYCKFKRYEVYKVYKDPGISAKNDKRPAYQEMMQDMRDGKINVIVAFKLDRLTRSVYDMEGIMNFLEENDAYLDCANDDINTTLDKLIEEKNKCCSDIERANAELKSCKELIDFLVLERDEMSKELDTKSKLLECYGALFNKDHMFHFREAKKK